MPANYKFVMELGIKNALIQEANLDSQTHIPESPSFTALRTDNIINKQGFKINYSTNTLLR